MITTLHFKQREQYLAYHINDRTLKSLNRVNLFIGQNNSGKSRFIRTLFKDKEFEYDLNLIDKNRVNMFLDSLKNEVKAVFREFAVIDYARVDEIMDSLKDWNTIVSNDASDKIKAIYNLTTVLSEMKPEQEVKINRNYVSSNINTVGLSYRLGEIGRKYHEDFSTFLPNNFEYKINKIYIPILRGLRPISTNAEYDEYIERTYKDYFYDTEVKIKEEIFTGLSLYEESKRLLLGKKEERDKIKNFESFLSRTFFQGQEVNLIPHIDQDVINVRIGDDEYPIHHLGDGIQSIIIILYPLFFNQGKTLLVFIEEPENSLHPGMQRVLLETLMQDEFKSFQYFISTHSNHFLDITLDYKNISVYSFNKQREGKFEINASTNSDIKLLDLIGVRNSSVFLSNCTIWVEGITDRLYIKKFLEVYLKHIERENVKIGHFIESLHYSFIEYAGSNITHWNFAETENKDLIKALSISNRIFVVADNDNVKDDSAKKERIENLKEILRKNFYVLDGKEIENVLPKEVLLDVIASYEGKKPENLTYKEGKKALFIPSKYKNKNIGEVIEATFTSLKRKYLKGSTISDKVNFCNKAVQYITDFESLTPEAQNMTKKIYEFIQSNNPKE